jgi:hypothetical protein
MVLGCNDTDTVSKSDALLAASESATFENVTRLGPHRFESILQRESTYNGQTTTEKVNMEWADWDNFQLQRSRNNRLRAENRVLRGKAFARSGKGRFRAASDAELYRVEMRHSASFWGRALEPFRGRVLAEPAESGTIDGRPAQRYTISLVDAPPPARGAHPISLNGEMWLDETTAVRLSGRLNGHFLKNGVEGQDVLIALTLKRDAIGIVPVIKRPENVRRSRF